MYVLFSTNVFACINDHKTRDKMLMQVSSILHEYSISTVIWLVSIVRFDKFNKYSSYIFLNQKVDQISSQNSFVL